MQSKLNKNLTRGLIAPIKQNTMKHTLKALQILFAIVAVYMLTNAGIQIINILNA